MFGRPPLCALVLCAALVSSTAPAAAAPVFLQPATPLHIGPHSAAAKPLPDLVSTFMVGLAGWGLICVLNPLCNSSNIYVIKRISDDLNAARADSFPAYMLVKSRIDRGPQTPAKHFTFPKV